MLYDLIQRRRGKDEVVMTDSLQRVNNRKKILTQSHRKGMARDRVEYKVVPTTSKEKFQKKPHNVPEHGLG